MIGICLLLSYFKTKFYSKILINFNIKLGLVMIILAFSDQRQPEAGGWNWLGTASLGNLCPLCSIYKTDCSF